MNQSLPIVSQGSTCPRCQKPNRCDLAAGKDSCWCFHTNLSAVPQATKDQYEGGACLCESCQKELAESAPSAGYTLTEEKPHAHCPDH
jgi:hypothetical protein